MSSRAIVAPVLNPPVPEALEALEPLPNLRPRSPRPAKSAPHPAPIHFPGQAVNEDGGYHQAELFYLQKQIQSQTPMVIVLEDGEQVEGCIEWFDRTCLKIRGRNKTLVYKSAIKYMHKLGEQGQ